MCSPAFAAAAVTAIGSVVSVAGQANALNAQAAFQDKNARLERERGKFLLDKEQRVSTLQRGKAINLAAASGGTVQDFDPVLFDNELESLQNESAVWFTSESRAQSSEDQAAIKRAEARSVAAGGFIGAISPLLKGFGSA